MMRSHEMAPDFDLGFEDQGSGPPLLLLHGGGGPATVAGLAARLSQTMRVLTPTHPGWNGTTRPADFNTIADIANAYLTFLAAEGLRDVLVVGSSLGGWIGAEMALRDHAGLVGGLTLINAVGIAVPDTQITNLFGMDPRAIADLSFHDPDRFFMDPATLPPDRIALQRGNFQTMAVYAGSPYMHDPQLLPRLGAIALPVQVIWGQSDRIVTPAYGVAYAAAFRAAEYVPIPKAGHLPQIEQPEATLAAITRFAAGLGVPPAQSAG